MEFFWLYLLLSVVVGAVTNRIAGGLTDILLERDTPGKLINAAIFLVFAMLTVVNELGSIDALLLLTIAYWAGRQVNHGDYIGAIMGKIKGTAPGTIEFKEVPQIDKLLGRRYNHSTDKVKWGTVGLSATGIVGTFLMGLTLHSIVFIAVGALKGPCYWLTVKFARRLHGNPGKGWGYGEYLYGGVLFGSLFTLWANGWLTIL